MGGETLATPAFCQKSPLCCTSLGCPESAPRARRPKLCILPGSVSSRSLALSVPGSLVESRLFLEAAPSALRPNPTMKKATGGALGLHSVTPRLRATGHPSWLLEQERLNSK